MINNKPSKKELVKILIKNQNLINNVKEEELVDMLLEENIAIDVDKEEEQKASFKEKLADKLTNVAGSWSFIIIFILFLIFWMIINVTIFKDLDPYPFILLNLLLSCLAALQAPIIMMSQNRQSKKDSLRSRQDYKTDLKSELILEEIHDHIENVLKNQKKLIKLLENLNDESSKEIDK